jgi:hypothetical protein
MSERPVQARPRRLADWIKSAAQLPLDLDTSTQ